jgi:hypothetical protein
MKTGALDAPLHRGAGQAFSIFRLSSAACYEALQVSYDLAC